MTTEKNQDGGVTPSQTVGPFFAYALTPAAYGYHELVNGQIATADAVGRRITLTGLLFDGDGELVTDGMIEIWQADGQGRFAGEAPGNAAWKGFGRSETLDGRFRFDTVKPGAVPGPDGRMQAPHIAVSVFARGVLTRLVTRVYFEDEPANAEDPVLALVPAERRHTLIARRSPADADVYQLDIRLQGEDETVFFEA